MDLTKYKDHFIVFTEAGFIAVNQADEDSAVKLFKAAALIDPNNLLPRVGMGYLHLCKLELKQACKVFDEILKEDPHNEMAKTFLGLCMPLNPSELAKGEKLLQESEDKAKDPHVKTLATSALEFVEKFVKKAPTPTQGQARKEKH
jgi:hypothetical protein